MRGDCLVARQRAGKSRTTLERVLTGVAALGAELSHLKVTTIGHGGWEEGRLVSQDSPALLIYKRNYFRDVAQGLINLLLTVNFVLDFLLLSHTQLTACLIKDFLQGGLFLSLYLLLEVLFTLALLLLPADYLSGLVQFLILSGPAVWQLDQIFSLSLLTLGLVAVVALGWGLIRERREVVHVVILIVLLLRGRFGVEVVLLIKLLQRPFDFVLLVGVDIIIILILHLIIDFVLILHVIGGVVVFFFRLVIGVLLVAFALAGAVVILFGVYPPCFFLLLDLELGDGEGFGAGDVGLELCVVLLFEVEADVDGDSGGHYLYKCALSRYISTQEYTPTQSAEVSDIQKGTRFLLVFHPIIGFWIKLFLVYHFVQATSSQNPQLVQSTQFHNFIVSVHSVFYFFLILHVYLYQIYFTLLHFILSNYQFRMHLYSWQFVCQQSFIYSILISFSYQVSNIIMDLNQAARPKKVYNVIQPNTTRVLQMRRQKMQKQLERRTLQEKRRREKEEEDRKYENLKKLRLDEQRLELKRIQEEERIKKQIESESNTLSGRFGHMINDLNTNTTNLEFTISGMDLRPAQIKVLISNVQNNSSLKGLTMCRKGLTDVEGCQVAENLSKNYYLERLELQGNNLGPETLTQISKLLATNESLRLVDLEGNKLIRGDDKPNYKGIQALVQALKTNETLLSLNLNGTGLDAACSRLLLDMVEHNSTLILLDIGNNPEMNIEDVTAIQNALLRNKQEYDDERYMEFIERKRMRREEDISGVLLLNQQTKKLRGEAIDLNIKTKKAQLDEEWSEFLASEQLKRQKEIVRMEKEAASKKGKKKKK